MMNYTETVELEKNIKIKDQAENLCRDFKQNVVLHMENYLGSGRFVLWSDSHNKIYVDTLGDYPVFRCRFLHEEYDVVVSPESVFSGIKAGYRGIDHLRSRSRKNNS